MKDRFRTAALTLWIFLGATVVRGEETIHTTTEDYIRANIPTQKEIDVFLNEMSWARFDPEVGYVLGSYMPRDGIDGSATFSTSQPDGTRTSYLYKGYLQDY